jgi:hypothetical protein
LGENISNVGEKEKSIEKECKKMEERKLSIEMKSNTTLEHKASEDKILEHTDKCEDLLPCSQHSSDKDKSQLTTDSYEITDNVNGTKDMTKYANRIQQKTKLCKEIEIFRDLSNHTEFSMSKRWNGVKTGNVKERANIYLKSDASENYKSPKIQRKIFGPKSWVSQDKNPNTSQPQAQIKNTNIRGHTITMNAPEANVAWRRNDISDNKRQEDVISPTLNLLSVSEGISNTSTITESIQDTIINNLDSTKDKSNVFSNSKTKKEAEDELDETIKQLKLHAESFVDNNKHTAKTKPVTSTTEMVTQAATSMKDAAGAVRAVREVAQSLLKTITSGKHPESRNTDQCPDKKGKHKILCQTGDENMKLDGTPKRQDSQNQKWEETDSEEDSYGYEDEFSVGIDLPLALNTTSGNNNDL